MVRGIQEDKSITRLLTFWQYRSKSNEWAHARALHRCVLLAAVVLLALFVWQAVTYGIRSDAVHREGIADGQARIDRIAEQIGTTIGRTERLTGDLASAIQRGDIRPEELPQRLADDSKKEPLLAGMGVAYRPHMYSPTRRLFAPFYETASGDLTQFGEQFDYAAPARFLDFRWHQEPALTRERCWITDGGSPSAEPSITHGVPFFRRTENSENGRVLGTAVAAVSINELTRVLNKGNVGRLGEGFLTDAAGHLLAHPRTEYVSARRPIADIARAENDEGLLSVAELIRERADGIVEGHHTVSGEPVLHFVKWLPEGEMVVCMTVYRDELFGHGQELRRRKMVLALTALLLITMVAVLAGRGYHLRDRGIWYASWAFSFSALAVLAFIWVLSLNRSLSERSSPTNERGGTRVLIEDQAGLEGLLKQRQVAAEEAQRKPPAVIPTGVFIRSIEFQGANDVALSGVVWQRYHIRDHEGLPRGIRFPGVAPDPEGLSIEELYRRKEGDFETIGWDFRAVLRIDLDYSMYPFDRQSLGLRIQHTAADQGVILAPDLGSYDLINTNSRPGLDTDIVLPGWHLSGSYFSYELISRNANFGLRQYPRKDRFPELQFNILVERQIITPFLSHAFPILVVIALLYGVLTSARRKAGESDVSGFSTFGVLEVCGAFFFGVILVHIDLRASLNSDVVTYMECLHLIGYLLLMLVAIDALIFGSSHTIGVIDYHENLLAKVAFWPCVMGLLLAATYLFLY